MGIRFSNRVKFLTPENFLIRAENVYKFPLIFDFYYVVNSSHDSIGTAIKKPITYTWN